jgi:hypothetical protein
MFIEIIKNTPVWVWALLVGLIVLGFSQTRSRKVALRKVVIMPIAMLIFSIVGTVSAFGVSFASVIPWLTAFGGTTALFGMSKAPEGSHFDSKDNLFSVPGSWLPMGIILAIFFSKFVVGASLAMQPNLQFELNFISAFSLLYGLFSGVFAGRTLRLIRMASAQEPINYLKA